MAGRIPPQFIDDLLARVDIVGLVEERVALRKAGREYQARCPFHEEKTPSFTVSPAKQFYHCFGCGAHGTAIGFLMEYDRLGFVEAVEALAERVGMEIPERAGARPEGPDPRPLYEALEAAAAFYRRALREHPKAAAAVAYLKGRGLTGEVARRFGLGFAPPGWDNLARALASTDPGVLEAAGLVRRGEQGGLYDRLRDRITFPIRDRRGRVVGFGARALGDETPKYLNSPETPVFHKGRELYGLHEARGSGARPARLVVVEGYMDVVALAQHGVEGAVATLGTAATRDQVELMFRTAPDVVFCFDGDAAGRRAAWRALENALALLRDGRQALFAFLPEGEDPDSLVRSRGREAFETLLAGAVPLSRYLFDHLADGIDLATLEGRSRLHETARPYVERLPPGAFRTLARRRLAELTGLDAEDSTTLSAIGPAPARRRRDRGGARAGSLVRRAVALLVNHPEVAAVVTEEARALAGIERPGVAFLCELLDTLQANPRLTPGALVERFRDHEMGRHLARLVAQGPELEEGLEQEFRDCLRGIAQEATRERERERLRALTAKRLADLSPAERDELERLTRRARDDGGAREPP